MEEQSTPNLGTISRLPRLKAQSEARAMCGELKESDFYRSLDVVLKSALTKFDSLSVYFSNGMTVQAVIAMLLEEMRQDEDFAPFLTDDLREKAFVKFVQQNVGKTFGAWKKGGTISEAAERSQQNSLSWPSIENYPEWVCEQIKTYLLASEEEKPLFRAELERTLLETPLWSVSTKYDGTCFGKMDTGDFVGRRHVVGKRDTYQNTSTSSAEKCKVEQVKDELSRMLGINLESGSVCVWGELMCNPGYYNYLSRGLVDEWLPFGIVFEAPDGVEVDPLLDRLQKEGMAYSRGFGRKFRLSMCSSLRRLLTEVGQCQVVEETFTELTHAEVVARGAKELMEGHNEGILEMECSNFFKPQSLDRCRVSRAIGYRLYSSSTAIFDLTTKCTNFSL